MYDFSGIWYHIVIIIVLMFIGILNIIIFEKPFKKSFNWKSKFSLSNILGIILGNGLLLYYFCILINPTVDVFVGSQYKQYGRRGLDTCYYFENGFGETKALYLNVFSKNRMMPNGFDVDIEYTIYYEKTTRIIVKVDK